jgi:hypothetical protein
MDEGEDAEWDKTHPNIHQLILEELRRFTVVRAEYSSQSDESQRDG